MTGRELPEISQSLGKCRHRGRSGSHPGRPEPKLINPPARVDVQSNVIRETAPKPVTHTEIAVSAKSDAEKNAFAVDNAVVIEGTQTDPADLRRPRKI